MASMGWNGQLGGYNVGGERSAHSAICGHNAMGCELRQYNLDLLPEIKPKLALHKEKRPPIVEELRGMSCMVQKHKAKISIRQCMYSLT